MRGRGRTARVPWSETAAGVTACGQAAGPGFRACADLAVSGRYGSSPRGAQGLVLAAKVCALLAGRLNVAFDDVVAMAPAVLRHRILRNFEGEADGVSPDCIIDELVTTLRAGATAGVNV